MNVKEKTIQMAEELNFKFYSESPKTGQIFIEGADEDIRLIVQEELQKIDKKILVNTIVSSRN